MIRLILGAVRLLVRPRRVSIPIEDYPALRHIEIKRGEPFRYSFKGSNRKEIFLEVDQLTVDDSIRCAQFQATIRGQIAKLAERARENPDEIVTLAATRAMFYRSLYEWFARMAERRVKRWRRFLFRREVIKHFEEHPARGMILFDKILEWNSDIDSFFFEMPRFNGRAIQPPNRDGWRAIGCENDREGRGDLLSTPILRIYDAIIESLERDTIERMNREKAEFEHPEGA